MKSKRRKFLQSAGAVSIVLAGGALWRAADQGVFSAGKGPAYAPWHDWNSGTGDGPMALVRAAILAANPHNTQPWRFGVSEQHVEVYADLARHLGDFDPYLREMHLGLGCAIENMMVAARAHGYAADLTLMSGRLGLMQADLEPQLVARIELAPASPEASRLYANIGRRHTHRGKYQLHRALPPQFLTELKNAPGADSQVRVFLFTSPAERKQFGDLVVNATATIIDDADMVHDSERWFRSGPDEIQELRDGLTIDAFALPAAMEVLAKMMPPPSPQMSNKLWLEATRDIHVASAPLFGFIAVRDLYDRQQTLRAGRVWQRMHLLATERGIAMHPINQPVEVVDRERQLQRSPAAASELAGLTRMPTWLPTFAFRAGFSRNDAAASPRRSAEQTTIT